MTTEAKQILFQSSLGEVVRKMRDSKKNEQETIQEAIAETKSELSSTVTNVKVTAIMKLAYFAMLGYSGEHGAFNIIEIMADSNFQHKRVGYIAASLIFRHSTDVLPLCTALLKRDMQSQNQYEVGLALFCLSCIATPDLARDLVADVVGLLYSPKPYIRKKAVLCLYKIFVQFPDGLRPTYPKLKEKLVDGGEKSDADPGVRGALVNIFCEMARRNPQNFITLVPPFFALLSSIHNNWTLIKVVKMFGYFAPHEPRLGKRLVDPLTALITTTHAKSVQYECIFAVANGMSKVPALIKLAVEKMKFFTESTDQNLKYLGLDAMCRTLGENPKILADQRATVLRCLTDVDPSIRNKALYLLKGLTTRKNLEDNVNAMFDAAVRTPPDEDWTNQVIKTIIDTVVDDDYANVADFEWYVAVLMDLAQINLTEFEHGALIEKEFINILTRVRAVRQYGIESLCSLLANDPILSSAQLAKSSQWRVLKAAAFLAGDFPHWIPNKAMTLRHLLSERVAIMAPELQVLCVTAAGKIATFVQKPSERHLIRCDGEEDNTDPTDATTFADVLRDLQGDATKEEMDALGKPPQAGCAIALPSKPATYGLSIFCRSVHPDVQERAQFVRIITANSSSTSSEDSTPVALGEPFFAQELGAVVEDAQKHVPVPEGLDLDKPFADDLPSLVKDSDADSDSDSSDDDPDAADRQARQIAQSAERIKRRRQDVDAYYLRQGDGGGNDDEPPIEELDLSPGPAVPARLSRARSGTKTQSISRDLAAPKGYAGSPHGTGSAKRDDSQQMQQEDEAARRLRNITVGKPLGADEVLPVIQPYKRVDPNSLSPKHGDRTDGGAGGDDALASLETRRLVAAQHFPEVEVLLNAKLRVVIQVLDHKAKKDGSVHVSMLCAAQNIQESHSLHHVSLSLATGADGDSSAAPKTQLADKEGTIKASIPLGDKIKGGSQASVEIQAVFAVYPQSISGAQVNFQVTFSTGKKEPKTVDAPLPLLVKYFMRDADEVTSDYFNSNVLDSLASAGCVSALIPLPAKYDLSRLLPLLPSLRLQVVDVFRDVVSLYGCALTRKSKLSEAHIAIALSPAEGEEGGGKSLNVMVKSHSTAHIEALVDELSGLIHQ